MSEVKEVTEVTIDKPDWLSKLPDHIMEMDEEEADKHAEKFIEEHSEWIDTVADRYHVPDAVIKSILYMEITRINMLDTAADLAVWSNLFPKKDSSTGPAQIFGRVGLEAVNFAVERGYTDYKSLNIDVDHVLDSNDPDDVRLIWKKLFSDEKANIEIATLNILSAADEMTGRVDFDSYNENEMKLVLTRYNADTRTVTPYGEEAYDHYIRYSKE